ncbi:carbonic anhydrase [Lentisphaerota bacterium WC36G]|nr:carbonic anhydrase [Lentisphaerae bacterium WC36]
MKNCFLYLLIFTTTLLGVTVAAQPSAQECLDELKAGNKRFVEEKAIHPHSNKARLSLAGKEDQGKYASATIITCSDSRVPVELIFDTGVMDIFVIRVAGNVCNTDEIGSIEYGLAHVNTPILVVLGHTQCGAVTAVTNAIEGHGHILERNIPALVAPIKPAVIKAKKAHPHKHGKELIPYAVEENVWQGIEDLFMKSPSTRKLVNNKKVKVIGAIYDVATGVVKWLSEGKTTKILQDVEKNPAKATNEFAEEKSKITSKKVKVEDKK